MKKAKQSHNKLLKHLDQVIEEQYLLRLEIIGQKITHVFHHFNPGKNQVHISDIKILHLPMGCLWIKTDHAKWFKIRTKPLEWNEFDNGIFIERIHKNDTTFTKNNVRSRSRLACWKPLLNQKITIAEWSWKGMNPKHIQQQDMPNKQQMIERVFKESLYPESLTLHFESNQKMHIIAADPDEPIEGTSRYNLITAGQEMMVFYCNGKLNEWGLGKPGFEISCSQI